MVDFESVKMQEDILNSKLGRLDRDIKEFLYNDTRDSGTGIIPCEDEDAIIEGYVSGLSNKKSCRNCKHWIEDDTLGEGCNKLNSMNLYILRDSNGRCGPYGIHWEKGSFYTRNRGSIYAWIFLSPFIIAIIIATLSKVGG